MTINKQRVLDEFFELIQISCPSLGEREVADLLKKRLEELGGKVTEDMQSAKALNGTAGNLVADFKGTVAGAPRILLNAHMDCVNPCAGIKPRIEDGVIKSDGTTILGGDDKGGVVARNRAAPARKIWTPACCIPISGTPWIPAAAPARSFLRPPARIRSSPKSTAKLPTAA